MNRRCTAISRRRTLMDLVGIQSVLTQRGFDAWLFYDHHHRDPIAYRILGLPEQLPVSRRWFYLIPAHGTPTKLVHRVEPGHLDPLPGTKQTYSAWHELVDQLKAMLTPFRRVAMQYSPNNLIFYVGMVDAGTVEMIRGFDHEIVSSGDLVDGDFVLLDIWAKENRPEGVFTTLHGSGVSASGPHDSGKSSP
jgi:Xaa-Pro dipeptidase